MPKLPCSHAEDLLMEELDGTLAGGEARGLRDHLESCADCRRAAEDYRRMATGLASLPLPEPGPTLEDRVASRIGSLNRRAAFWRVAARAAALLLVAAGLYRVLGPAPARRIEVRPVFPHASRPVLALPAPLVDLAGLKAPFGGLLAREGAEALFAAAERNIRPPYSDLSSAAGRLGEEIKSSLAPFVETLRPGSALGPLPFTDVFRRPERPSLEEGLRGLWEKARGYLVAGDI